MTVVSCCLLTGLASTGLSGCHGIGVVHNNKTTPATSVISYVSDGVLFFDSQTKNARKVHLAVKIQLPK
jgi:hypothetical protein